MDNIETELDAVSEIVDSCLAHIDKKSDDESLCGHCILTGAIIQLLVTALEHHGKEEIDEFVYKHLLPLYEDVKKEKVDKKKLN